MILSFSQKKLRQEHYKQCLFNDNLDKSSLLNQGLEYSVGLK